MPYYLSLQYSAIQKTVLRHNRLWSIAGISQGLARLNEVTLPGIVKNFGGEVLVAGGGKFTARFQAKDDPGGGAAAAGEIAAPAPDATARNNATAALREIRKAVAKSFPMLEFQMVAAPRQADTFCNLWYDPKNSPRKELDEQKRRFRGYGVSFSPQLALCPECGEYPADRDKKGRGSSGSEFLCAACHAAQDEAWRYAGNKRPPESGPSIECVYARFYDKLKHSGVKAGDIPINFEDLAKWRGKNDDTKPLMAVWFSDLNNMNSKVPLWTRQEDDDLKKTFKAVTEVNIAIIVESLFHVFKDHARREYLPFRLIVAGGDDLIIAMDEPFILPFCRHYSQAMARKLASLGNEHQLSKAWLKNKNQELCRDSLRWAKRHKPDEEPTPYCFGGSFVVTSTHTPFRRIHEVGEELMGEAKRKTKRAGNSVNWVIMAAEKEPLTERLLRFDKPLFIEMNQDDLLSMNEYIGMIADYKNAISGTQRQRMVAAMIECRQDKETFEERMIGKALEDRLNGKAFEDWMIGQAARETDEIYGRLLMDKRFRRDDETLFTERLATLLELMGIEELPKGGNR